MKKILVILMAALLVSHVFANLLDEVDKLTPKQAEQFQKKLDDKKFEGLPVNTRISGGIQTVNGGAFNAAFPGLPPLHSVLVGSFDVRQPLTDKLLIGGSFSGAGNFFSMKARPRSTRTSSWSSAAPSWCWNTAWSKPATLL